MTEEHWAEIGAALRKANDAKPQPDFVPSIALVEGSQDLTGTEYGTAEPHKFSWLTMKLFGWLLNAKLD